MTIGACDLCESEKYNDKYKINSMYKHVGVIGKELLHNWLAVLNQIKFGSM